MAEKKLPEGIVVFKFTGNECYTEIVDTIPEGLEIDLKQRTWASFRDPAVAIGKSDYLPRGYSRGNHIIGVFDTRDFKQLQRLVSLSAEIVRER